MAGQPLKRRVLVALQARAVQALGEGADILDFACNFIAAGGRVSELAQQLAADIGHSVSRPLVSGILHGLSDDATARLEAARREGALALVDEAVQIADDAELTTAGVQKARLQVGTRHWMAERFSPEVFGQRAPAAVQLNIGQLFLEALKQPPPALPIAPTPTQRQLTSDVEADRDYDSPSA